MRVTHNVYVQIDGATGTQTDAAVASAIETAVAALSGYNGGATVYVKSIAGSSMQDVATSKQNPVYPTA